MRQPRGFSRWDVPVGVLFLREEDDGSWVILAGDPMVKLDNRHTDRQPHIHLNGWEGDETRDLRPDLTGREAAEAIARQLEAKGYLDPERLAEELA